MTPAYRRSGGPTGGGQDRDNGPVEDDEPVVAAPGPLCNRVLVDLDGPEPNFTAVGNVTGDRVVVAVTGEVDMSTADVMFEAATKDGVPAATLDLRAVTFFDSAAIHALILLAERYPDTLHVLPSTQVRRVLEISGLAGQPWLLV
ncbi:STAS domain-containing protein [Micromonosporaceae bacterium Da 78-11]